MSGLPPYDVVQALYERGYAHATGVPCAMLSGVWQEFENRGSLLPAVSEGVAVAIAAGWEMGGKPGVVLAQNSGLGHMVNPLASLVIPCKLPILVLLTMRGWPDPANDEPQHAVMGAATISLLDDLGVRHGLVGSSDDRTLERCLGEAHAAHAARLPYFLLIGPGAIDTAMNGGWSTKVSAESAEDEYLTRSQVVAALLEGIGDALLICPTGYLSREVAIQGDRSSNFYMQGSMGHALGLGIGVATARPNRRVVVLDGDGAALMHLGAGATAAFACPTNLTHLVVDNRSYESTGGQRSHNERLDWAGLGRALGYGTVTQATTKVGLRACFKRLLSAEREGPAMCHISVRPTLDDPPPRVTASMSHPEMASRFRTIATSRA